MVCQHRPRHPKMDCGLVPCSQKIDIVSITPGLSTTAPGPIIKPFLPSSYKHIINIRILNINHDFNI
jgi:hypothetical protein